MPTDASDFRYIPNHNHHLLTNKHRSYESIKTTGSISSSGIGRGNNSPFGPEQGGVGKSPRRQSTAARGCSRSGRWYDQRRHNLRKRHLQNPSSVGRSRSPGHLPGLPAPESDGSFKPEQHHDLPARGRHHARCNRRNRLRYAEKSQPDRRRCDRREQGARKPRHPFAGQHVAGFRSGSQHHHLLG